MGFTNIVFVFIFFPIVLLLYFGIMIKSKIEWKNMLLLVASIVFYAWCGIQYLVILIALLIVSYIGIALIQKNKKLGLIFTITINVVVLVIFKYFNFFVESIEGLINNIGKTEYIVTDVNLPLPLGISFIVFQIISFTIDTYNGKIKKISFIDFAIYIIMFPQLIEGPIVRYEEIEKQLYQRNVCVDDIYHGMRRFVIGMAKKVLIADVLVSLSDKIFEIAKTGIPMGYAWLGAVTYAFVIYFDFSGYTDMAIGLCRIFGFNIGENFNYPYMAITVQDFWRRWHMSLTSWFRDYIYIPLGGNRKGTVKTYRNLMIVYLLTGIWHGASWTFIVWGVFHGLFQLLERVGLKKVLLKIPSFFSRIYCMIVVIIGWVFFRANTLTDALSYIKDMFSINNMSYKQLDILLLINGQSIFTLIVAAILSTNLIEKCMVKINNNGMKIAMNIALLVLFLISLTSIVTSSFNPSIYTKF